MTISNNMVELNEESNDVTHENSHKQIKSRNKEIIKASVVGIAANLLLAALKVVVGTITHSISITIDALNNISDSASSIITIVGTKLASKAADREHPFGHKRGEYLSARIISALILYAGLTSLFESIKKIIKPVKPNYDLTSLIIVTSAIFVKIFLAIYTKKKGNETNSESLNNSGKDAMLDSIISVSTLAAAIIFLISGVSLESWLGVFISLFIINSGFKMLNDTTSQLLGERADSELSKNIRNEVMKFPDVYGVCEIILNNYGPNFYYGSLNIEVPDTFSADEIDKLEREITEKIYKKYNVNLTSIGIHSVNTKDKQLIEIRNEIEKLLSFNPYVLQTHGFLYEKENNTINFDIVIGFNAENRNDVFNDIVSKIKELYPKYNFNITMDTDFSES